MPAASDILQFLRGQLLQTPSLPTVSFTGKTVVVTGANTGLGYECAKHLVQLGVSTLILGCRDVSKGEAAKSKLLLERKEGVSIRVWKVDMASFASVKSFAQKIENELPRLDVLLANAGMSTNKYRVAEHIEETLTVNVVSTFLLAVLCLPKLRHTAVQMGSPTNLTITGSVVHCFADHTELECPPNDQVFQSLSDETQAKMDSRYFLSKLIVLLCAQEMAKCVSRESKSQSPQVVINCPNPGWCKTELFRQDDGGAFARNLLRIIGRTSEVGARTLTSAIAAGPDSHGSYLSECRVKPASTWVRSRQGKLTQKKIWEELLDILEHISPGVSDNLGRMA